MHVAFEHQTNALNPEDDSSKTTISKVLRKIPDRKENFKATIQLL